MKMLFFGLLVALTVGSAQAQDWPRNAAGKVEFTGLLPWPPTVKTEAQRQALVRRWYLAKLTELTPDQVKDEEDTAVSTSLLTYAGLPLVTMFEAGQLGSRYQIYFDAHLTSTKTGLRYQFNRLAYYGPTTPAESEGEELEQHLAQSTAAPESEKTALATLRERFSAAVAGWPKK